MRNLAIILSLIFVITVGCVTMTGRSEPTGDVYEGTGQGYRGTIKVQVRIDKGAITDIVIAESQEDRFVGGAAIEELIEVVIENNSTDVDVISGATITSKGFLDAVNNARRLARN